MAVTNAELADMIGAVDDKVVVLTGDIHGVRVLSEANAKGIAGVQKGLDTMNGRQREDHGDILTIKAIQDNCPGRKKNPKDDTEDDSMMGFAKWNIKQLGIFGALCAMNFGLMLLCAKAIGLI